MSDAVKETHAFDTEIDALMHLMVHSLYSNKEIFLRELISNASDAADKLRFEGYKNTSLYGDDTELNIRVAFDEKARTITIQDNGIGMSLDEVKQNLGTIAKSGTKAFLESLSGDSVKDAGLIGQFGVGFYSSFIIADHVVVRTRRAGAPSSEGVEWSSNGKGEYSVETIDQAERGTSVTLHLKADESEFLNGMRLRHIITKYSDHINFPVIMKTETFPLAEDEQSAEKVEEEAADEVVNRAMALWAQPKADITDEQYQSLYKHISHDFDDAAIWAHNKVEGKYEYTSLLYVPKKAPFDMGQPDRAKGLKLYVRRVFIMDDADQFLPNHLRFVRGIIDSSDLPLNISREILQNNRVVESIRTAIVKRVLGMLSDMATNSPEEYAQFWSEFGQILKEGLVEDYLNRDEVAKLLRFASTDQDEATQNVSLEDYISRMPEGQDKIYYVAADSFSAAKNSPHLEAFREKGIEVLLMFDRIDEWVLSHYTAFNEKTFQSVAKGALDDLDFSKEKTEEKSSDSEPTAEEKTFLERVEKTLGEKVKAVRLTQRLRSSPACIVADDADMTRQMERLLKSAGQTVDFKPVLELNLKHMLVQKLEAQTDESRFEEWAQLLLDQAVLAEGGQLEDPASFVRRFNEILLSMTEGK